ncbi:hypothetical protein AALP_AA3G041200 [Arabis alpina]|uniref:F-box associated beta-propeller type 3 domain-containing protein n=1 Tax=Arabis alpina TaxID=50452 RepID=A0A087H6X7_ARAAL|nr:hypothetical protein AALP_AA3G041200 [Arabis alpina]
MKKKKKTIEKKSLQCVTRSQKKREESEENDPFRMITLDLKMEILMKLPAKSVAKLNFVSNLFSSMIRSKEFTDLYMARSSTRPRLLFRVYREGLHFFHSCSQENPSYDHRERVSITLNPNLDYVFSQPVRGLICGRKDSRVLIGNPSTGQFITLPRVRTGQVWFLGYEPVNDVYKVLCVTEKRNQVSEEHQVFILGAQRQQWRMVKCNHPHIVPPYQSTGLCINGVVYYYGWIRTKRSIISFDLRSEEFNLVNLPDDVKRGDGYSDLVNYHGKVAFFMDCNGTLLWVLEDASKQEWSKVSFLISAWEGLPGLDRFLFCGALSTGELIFTPDSSRNPFYFISYDLKENITKKVVVQGIGDNLTEIEIFCDHVESPMVLSNVS